MKESTLEYLKVPKISRHKIGNSPGFEPCTTSYRVGSLDSNTQCCSRSIPDIFPTQVAPCHFSGPLKCFFQQQMCARKTRIIHLSVSSESLQYTACRKSQYLYLHCFKRPANDCKYRPSRKSSNITFDINVSIKVDYFDTYLGR